VTVNYKPIPDPSGGYLANSYTVEIESGAQTVTGVAAFDPTGALISLTTNAANDGTVTPDGASPPTTLTFTPTLPATAFTMNLADLGLSTSIDAKRKYNPSFNSMAMYASDPSMGVKPDFEI